LVVLEVEPTLHQALLLVAVVEAVASMVAAVEVLIPIALAQTEVVVEVDLASSMQLDSHLRFTQQAFKPLTELRVLPITLDQQ
jgi:hypothetical protein